MMNLVKKLNRSDWWRIGEHESWYSDMSKKGLHLYSIGKWVTKFKKDEPLDLEYRIEISTDKGEISRAQYQLYKEFGWNYVTTNGSFHIFSAPKDQNATEIHTDPVEQGYALKTFGRKLAMDTIISSIGFISAFIILYFYLLKDYTPYLTLINNPSIVEPLIAISIIVYVIISIQSNISIHKLRKSLIQGTPINHKSNWKKHRFSARITYVFVIYMYISICFSIFLPSFSTKAFSLPDATSALPIVRLMETEPEGATFVYPSANDSDGINHNKYYTNPWHPLCPINYNTYESARSFSKTLDNKMNVNDVCINSQVYRASFDFITNGLFTDLKNKYFLGSKLQEINYEGIDKLLLQETNEGYNILTRSGKTVIYLEYVGESDPETIIKLIHEKLALLENNLKER
ncbi:MAG: DUF2812 domain-containing protein [Clostridium sp.]|uniref:DUF2812 domain-containing protein n=1 Tax=Clostridium sp. TaxID=1506 RepID=UPI003072EDE9